MGVTGIDIAWDRPTIPQIKATGATWVARYFSTDPSKNLTAAEVRDYHAAGLGIVTVWETTTARATQGYQAGIDDAGLAEGQRKAVGLPGDMVIHFAVDEDTDWASVADYFRGAHVVLGSDAHGIPRTGTYGGFRVIEGAHAAGYRFLWQTVAWSGGRWSAHATIRQPGGMTLSGAADYDTAETPDFGQYPRPTSEVDMDANQNQMLVDLHNALPLMGWGYKNTKIPDPYDMHQALRNADTNSAAAVAAVRALAAPVASIGTAVAALTTAVAKLGSADAALLADLQAAQSALAGIPAQIAGALKDGVVHVDVAVTGPAPAKP